MSIKQKICPHQANHQVITAHGLFCLDCGFLDEKSPKNKRVVQRIKPPASKPGAATATKDLNSKIIKHIQPARTAETVKIGMADITPRKRI